MIRMQTARLSRIALHRKSGSRRIWTFSSSSSSSSSSSFASKLPAVSPSKCNHVSSTLHSILNLRTRVRVITSKSVSSFAMDLEEKLPAVGEFSSPHLPSGLPPVGSALYSGGAVAAMMEANGALCDQLLHLHQSTRRDLSAVPPLSILHQTFDELLPQCESDEQRRVLCLSVLKGLQRRSAPRESFSSVLYRTLVASDVTHMDVYVEFLRLMLERTHVASTKNLVEMQAVLEAVLTFVLSNNPQSDNPTTAPKHDSQFSQRRTRARTAKSFYKLVVNDVALLDVKLALLVSHKRASKIVVDWLVGGGRMSGVNNLRRPGLLTTHGKNQIVAEAVKGMRRGKAGHQAVADLFHAMKDNSNGIVGNTWNLLASSLSRCGDAESIAEIMYMCRKRKVAISRGVYSAACTAYASRGDITEVAALVRECASGNIRLDTVFFTSIMTAFMTRGDVKSTMMIYEEMKMHKVKADSVLYDRLFRFVSRRHPHPEVLFPIFESMCEDDCRLSNEQCAGVITAALRATNTNAAMVQQWLNKIEVHVRKQPDFSWDPKYFLLVLDRMLVPFTQFEGPTASPDVCLLVTRWMLRCDDRPPAGYYASRILLLLAHLPPTAEIEPLMMQWYQAMRDSNMALKPDQAEAVLTGLRTRATAIANGEYPGTPEQLTATGSKLYEVMQRLCLDLLGSPLDAYPSESVDLFREAMSVVLSVQPYSEGGDVGVAAELAVSMPERVENWTHITGCLPASSLRAECASLLSDGPVGLEDGMHSRELVAFLMDNTKMDVVPATLIALLWARR